MSEIEKVYENVGFIKKQCKDYSCIVCNKNKDCDKYPPFTSEKQIGLIKWLVKHRFNFMVYELTEKDFTFEILNKRLKQTSQFVSLSENNFEEGLAKVLNCFWQDLTEEEKQQIKEILE